MRIIPLIPRWVGNIVSAQPMQCWRYYENSRSKRQANRVSAGMTECVGELLEQVMSRGENIPLAPDVVVLRRCPCAREPKLGQPS
jgi:hypothetical protein